MKRIRIISLMAISLAFMGISCTNEENNDILGFEENLNKASPQYIVKYTEQQLENWKNTGSPYLDDELDNSSNTLIDPTLPAQGGVFKPLESTQTRAWGVSPQQNRFWTMIRLKIKFNPTDPKKALLKANIIDAMEIMENETNLLFYNTINSVAKDPTWGFEYPDVSIKVAEGKQIGSAFIGRKGGEQIIYLPTDASVGFIIRAFCNVAGMYNEQQRSDRDTYVTITTSNIDPINRFHFDKITKNYYGIGGFDQESVTLAGTYDYSSKPNLKSIVKKNGSIIVQAEELSERDKYFLNTFYLPYVPRTDTYRQLKKPVFKSDNTKMSDEEVAELERRLNNGAPYPEKGDDFIINTDGW